MTTPGTLQRYPKGVLDMHQEKVVSLNPEDRLIKSCLGEEVDRPVHLFSKATLDQAVFGIQGNDFLLVHI